MRRLGALPRGELVHVHLASIYARMGYLEAAQRQANIVPVSAARMLCQIDCLLSAGRLQIEAGELEAALRTVPEIMDLVQRGIECGAIVDPWNLLGFDGHFSLFPAPSNSVPDHRVDQLVDLVESVLGYCSQLWAEAASRDLPLVCGRIKLQLEAIAHWWYEFAPHEVSSSGAINPKDLVKAADHVAQALTLWHRGGSAAGDVEFWSKHAKMFDSPQAYALVIEALLQRDDVSTVMALLIHWLSRSEAIPLLVADCSFHQLVARWLLRLKEQQAARFGRGIRGVSGPRLQVLRLRRSQRRRVLADSRVQTRAPVPLPRPGRRRRRRRLVGPEQQRPLPGGLRGGRVARYGRRRPRGFALRSQPGG